MFLNIFINSGVCPQATIQERIENNLLRFVLDVSCLFGDLSYVSEVFKYISYDLYSKVILFLCIHFSHKCFRAFIPEMKFL